MRRRSGNQNEAQAEMGKRWAEQHFLTNGRPEPPKYNNAVRDEACAERWHELAGKYPSWYTYLAEREGGWWIVNADGAACDCGPYDTKGDALSDAKGMENFAKYHDKPGFITSEKKRKAKPTTEAGKTENRGKNRSHDGNRHTSKRRRA